jgi:elongation factor Ts
MTIEISAADVKVLRDRTGAGMMDCKAALEEARGDTEKAIEILRVKGQASAAKRSGRSTGEGVVSSYIHATGKVGVLVEVQCETDFVARTDEFRSFAHKVVAGQLAKWEREVALLEQEHINADRYEGKTIEELRAEIAAQTGENVTITRFARFEVGEA